MKTTTGNYPWAIIPCKHMDQPGEPWSKSFLTDFFLTPGKQNVFDYWKEISFGNLSMEGSKLFDWVPLPYNAKFDFDRDRGQRIVAAAQEAAKKYDLRSYSGIIIVFNSNGDGGSVGVQELTLNGQTKSYGLVNLSANASAPGAMDMTFVLHEMGHGLGYEHSFVVPTLGADGCYGNRTDLMSAMNVFGFQHINNMWGSAGPGLNAPNLLDAGWLDITYQPYYLFPVPDARRVLYANRSTSSMGIQLRALHTLRPADNYGYRMLYFDLDDDKTGASYLSFEFRLNEGWDFGLPETGIVIHKVVRNTSYVLKPASNRWIWRTGEQYTDAGVVFRFGPFDKSLGLASLTVDNQSFIPDFNRWKRMPGALKQISAGSRDNIWGVNTGNEIYCWTENTWKRQIGSLQQISAAADGSVWGVNEQNKVYRRDGTVFLQAPGLLRQVSAGAKQHIWGVNAANAVFRWSTASSQFEQIPGSLKQVSVGKDGVTCGVNPDGEVYWWNGRYFEKQESAQLKQVSVANVLNIWGINDAGDVYRHYFGYEGWEKMNGKLAALDVSEDGIIHGVNTADEIFEWTGSEWKKLPGLLRQVATGSAAHIWGVNAAGQIFRWTGSAWQNIPGVLNQISAASDGAVWGINPDNNIFYFDGSAFKQVTGQLKQISAGAATRVWGVNAGNELFRWEGLAFVKVADGIAHVSANANGDVWAIGAAGNEGIFYWHHGKFERFANGLLNKISVGLPNVVWGINGKNEIFRLRPGRWLPAEGKLSHITVGNDGTVMGVNEQQQIFLNTPRY
ncbi:MAG: hypothetical protein LCH81_12475 [Bacteroidetes bacterium]|nr:hypothetical protein [Bacteroidota bacterium]